jgi:hypothetical protein
MEREERGRKKSRKLGIRFIRWRLSLSVFGIPSILLRANGLIAAV